MLVWEVLIARKLFVTHKTTSFICGRWGVGGGGVEIWSFVCLLVILSTILGVFFLISLQIYCCLGALSIADSLQHVNADMLGWWLCERQLPSGGLNGEK